MGSMSNKIHWPINPVNGDTFSYIDPIGGATICYFIYVEITENDIYVPEKFRKSGWYFIKRG